MYLMNRMESVNRFQDFTVYFHSRFSFLQPDTDLHAQSIYKFLILHFHFLPLQSFLLCRFPGCLKDLSSNSMSLCRDAKFPAGKKHLRTRKICFVWKKYIEGEFSNILKNVFFWYLTLSQSCWEAGFLSQD